MTLSLNPTFAIAKLYFSIEPPLPGEVTSEAKSEGPCPFAVVHTAQFFSGIFGWLYSIFYKYEQNMSPPS